ncbi:MAG: hypothetical protein BWY13_01169 [Euryarchaeota archaeon ADurb.Bin190]|nr:MAG: hypothetical protein BWY13_01169 [Euryarchaeota archaeon ADurb.Bin190]
MILGTSDFSIPVISLWNINLEPLNSEKNGNAQSMISAYRRKLKTMNTRATANPNTILACLLHLSLWPKK